MIKPMRALVTGAEGFIGHYLTTHLNELGYDVCATTKTTDEKRVVKDAHHIMKCDVREYNDVRHALSKWNPNIIFHLAAQSYPTISYNDPWLTYETNALGTINIFEAVKELKLPMHKIIVACSSAEYGIVDQAKLPVKEDHPLHPIHPYGASKVSQDHLTSYYRLVCGMPATSARLFNTTGPGKSHDAVSDFAKRIVDCENRKITYVSHGNLDCWRDITDVKDMVSALERCVDARPDVYNLCSGRSYNMKQLLRLMTTLSSRKVKLRKDATLCRPLDERIIAGDNTKFIKETGWKTYIPIKTTLNDVLEHFRGYPNLSLVPGIEQ